jgi:small subunit ribosomal protein S16
MARRGAIHRPFYRIVVNDSTRRPEAGNIDELGFYDPMKKDKALKLDVEKTEAWIRKGAVASDRVRAFLKKAKAGAR